MSWDIELDPDFAPDCFTGPLHQNVKRVCNEKSGQSIRPKCPWLLRHVITVLILTTNLSDHCGPGFPGCCPGLYCQSVGLRRITGTKVCKHSSTPPASGPFVKPAPAPGAGFKPAPPDPSCCPVQGKLQCKPNTQVSYMCVKLSDEVGC